MSAFPKQDFTVYIVDNDPAVYESLLSVDDYRHWNLHFSASFSELCQAIDQCWTGCLVIEANLKPDGGLQLYKNLIENGLALPTIFVTTCGSITEAVESLKLGALDYIEKPFIHSRLTATIRTITGLTPC